MKAEKLIKEKLNELNEIPDGFHFDQADTWKRLQTRMDADSYMPGPSWLHYPVLWFTQLKHAISRLFAGDGNRHLNRRRSRKGVGAKKGYGQR